MLTPAEWTGIAVFLAILLIFALRPVLFRYAERHHWKRTHKESDHDHTDQPR